MFDFPVTVDMMVQDFQDIKKNFPRIKYQVPDYGPMMNYVDRYHADIDYAYFDNLSINVAGIQEKIRNSTEQVQLIQVAHRLIADLVKNYRYKCLARCRIDDVMIQKFISAGVGGGTYEAILDHHTVHEYSLDPSFLNNSQGSISVVIKCLIDEVDISYKCATLHEASIGIALNSISHMTPNFMYFYGLLPIDLNYDMKQPQDSVMGINNEYPGVLVFELIKGESLRDWLRYRRNNIDEQVEYDVRSVIAQVLMSLYIANQMIEYTHFDLHDNNVMVVKLDSFKTIRYQLPDGTSCEWQTQYVAKIIDYGRSYAKVNGIEMIADTRAVDYGIDDQSNHQYDIVKFMMVVMAVLRDVDTYYRYMKDLIVGPLTLDNLKLIVENYVKFYNPIPVDQRKFVDVSLTGYGLAVDLMAGYITFNNEYQKKMRQDVFNEFITVRGKKKISKMCPSLFETVTSQMRQSEILLAKNMKDPEDTTLRNIRDMIKSFSSSLEILKRALRSRQNNIIITYNDMVEPK